MNRQKTTAQIIRKIKLGELTRPFNCELCDKLCISSYTGLGTTFAHHACGYNNPFDVWWICIRCNNVLRGEKWHSGQVSKKEARQYIKAHPPPAITTYEHKVHYFKHNRTACGRSLHYLKSSKRLEVTCRFCKAGMWFRH